MTEKVLPYDRAVVPQERGWSCGPAATQVVLNGIGIVVTESDLISQIGTHTGGTDDISWIDNRALDSRVPQAKYDHAYITKDPPTKAQKDKLWRDVTGSIDAGFGVVMNWVAPPNNYPRGIKGSVSPAYGGSTIYHYVACMGYDDDPANRAFWIADSGFRPFGYWVSFDQAASLIAPKGYAYSTATVTPSVPQVVGRDRYALDIINEGRRVRSGQGQFDHPVMTPRGITIALATALVESNLTMYASSADTESLKYPHEAVGSDFDSSGLFQQRPPWWGTVADRMDPSRSAAMFYHALSGQDYNNPSRSPGSYAQAVQQSAFPGRYDERYGDAAAIYSRLAGAEADQLENWETLMSDTTQYPSRSPYRDNDNKILTARDALFNIDAMAHAGLVVEPAALRGEAWALEKVLRLANGQGPGARMWFNSALPDAWAIAKARYIIRLVEQSNPDALKSFISSEGKAA